MIEWKHNFPPRPQQEDTLDWVNENEKDCESLIVEAPTGVGKSPICSTVAKDGGGIILTPQMILQEQYVRDFPWLDLLKGKANYTCHSTGKNCKESEILCKKKCGRSGCPYLLAKSRFFKGTAGTTNYAYLFSILPYLTEEELRNKKWLIFDEGHHLESQLIESSSIHISESLAKGLGVDFITPSKKSYHNAVLEIEKAVRVKISVLVAKIDSDEELSEQENSIFGILEDLLTKITMYKVTEEEHDYVFYTSDEDQKEKFWGVKPVFARGAWKNLITPIGKKTLITTATVLDHEYFAECIGLKSYAYMGIESPFKVSNRKVFYKPQAKLNFGNMKEEFPKVVQKIVDILEKFADYKGIIHSHSFKMTEQLFWLIPKELRWRLVQHRPDSNRDEILNKFLASDKPLVMMSPSMTEGVDLKEDLGRFAIFPKMPYPSLGDAWVKARNAVDPLWYPNQVAKTIIQGSGRVCRSEDDWGYTYILDANFENFFDRNSGLIPEWFQDAIK